MKNYYKIMGLPMTASESEIEAAFKTLAKQYSSRGEDAEAAARFAEINEAYSVLSNVVMRSRYDKTILVSSQISVPLTDEDNAPTSENPRVAMSRIQTVRPAAHRDRAQHTDSAQTQPKTEHTKPADTHPHSDTVKTEPQATQEKPKEKPKTIAETIAERAAAVREAYEKAAEQMAARREAENKAREAKKIGDSKPAEVKHSAQAEPSAQDNPQDKTEDKPSENPSDKDQEKPQDKSQEKPQEKPLTETAQAKSDDAQAAKARHEAIERELAAHREREKKARDEQAEIERARAEAATIKQKNADKSDVKLRMQALLSRLGEKQSERAQAVEKAQNEAAAQELAKEKSAPEPFEPKEVGEYVKTVEAIPADESGAKKNERRLTALAAQYEREFATFRKLIEDLGERERQNAAALSALTEEVRKLKAAPPRVTGTVSEEVKARTEEVTASLMQKLSEAEASAEVAAASAKLHAAEARQLQEEVDEASKRLHTAMRDLETVTHDKHRLETEMQAEVAARRRAESAIEGAKQAARGYKVESERAAKRALEEKNARMSAERAFSSEAKARKRAEELSKQNREAVARMSHEISALKVAKDRAELKAEEIRTQITRTYAAAEKERLEKLSAQQKKIVAELGDKLSEAEADKQSLEAQVSALKQRASEQQALDREIAKQMSDYEQFKKQLSAADEERLIADWETKVRADVMLFKDTLYGTLGIPYYANVTEIAERADALKARYAARDEDDRYDKIAAVEHAREVLTDPQKRSAYNAEIGLAPSEVNAAVKAKACYNELVKKLGREKAAKAFWDKFDELAAKAQTGDAEAQNRLGEAYYDGVDIPSDPAQAVFWFKESAKQLYPAALFNMGICLLNGFGVERDEVRGRGFVKKAAMCGYKPAIELSETPEMKRQIKSEY